MYFKVFNSHWLLLGIFVNSTACLVAKGFTLLILTLPKSALGSVMHTSGLNNIVVREIQHCMECDKAGPLKYRCNSFFVGRVDWSNMK